MSLINMVQKNNSIPKNFEEVSLPRTKDEWSNDGGQGDNGSDVEVQHCSFLLDKHLQKHSWLAKNSIQKI